MWEFVVFGLIALVLIALVGPGGAGKSMLARCLPGLLPGRRHIVLTRDPDWSAVGAERAATVDEALELADGERVSVIGGAEIFRLFEPDAEAVELTELHFAPEGDTLLPPFDTARWREVRREDHAADDCPRLQNVGGIIAIENAEPSYRRLTSVGIFS